MGLVLSACSIAKGEGTSQETFSDPHDYCAGVGQIDAPDALFKDYLIAAGLDANGDYPGAFKKMTVWRCYESSVLRLFRSGA